MQVLLLLGRQWPMHGMCPLHELQLLRQLLLHLLLRLLLLRLLLRWQHKGMHWETPQQQQKQQQGQQQCLIGVPRGGIPCSKCLPAGPSRPLRCCGVLLDKALLLLLLLLLQGPSATPQMCFQAPPQDYPLTFAAPAQQQQQQQQVLMLQTCGRRLVG
jgi:hypothetical protein